MFSLSIMLSLHFVCVRCNLILMQDLKEYTDAEGLMSLPTSDLHNPTVCLGNRRLMRCITNDASPLQLQSFSSAAPIEMTTEFASNSNSNGSKTFTCNSNGNHRNHPQHQHQYQQQQSQHLHHSNNNLLNNKNNNTSGDLASFDSSDTYASCQTHPFLSQGDLTGDMADISCMLDELDMEDLYFTSLEKRRPTAVSSTLATAPHVDAMGSIDDVVAMQVKKSASGDAGLHSLAGPPMDEVFQTFQSFEMASRIDRGSHVSLNEPPVPKHRKTRFQQASFNKGKIFATPKKLSHDSLDETPTTSSSIPLKKIRRSSFMPPKSIVSATKLINQHLFGIQYSSSKSNSFILCSLTLKHIHDIFKTLNLGKSEDKAAASEDSSETSPNVETHRRSKSILKNKSDSSKTATDPESEMLLSENVSNAVVSENGSVSTSNVVKNLYR